MIFPLTEFIGWSAYVTFGGRGGIFLAARSELPYPGVSQAESRVETPQKEKLCDDVESWV